MSNNVYEQILVADDRIRPYVVETPLIPSPALSLRTVASVYLKLENRQHTGSFKLRGATNKILSLSEDERRRGVVTASTGNHGLAVAHAAARLDVAATIYLPESAAPQKVEKLRHFAVDLRFVGGDAINAELTARRVSEEVGKPFISPYNDLQVMAGQGTVGVELLRQRSDLDVVLVAVGGGGLIGGIASYMKRMKPEIEIIGCLPLNSPVMAESVRRGQIVEMDTLPTLSDGTAGGIEVGAVTFAVSQRYVDHWLLVDEAAIADAIRLIYREHREVIEGAAAVPVASLLFQPGRWQGKTIAVVLCGGNIDSIQFAAINGLTLRDR
jgi:threonine dehydratase